MPRLIAPAYWYTTKRPWQYFLLWPLGKIYALVMVLRHALYRHQIFKTTHLPVPVIVVGNVTVGGTGKTPCVHALVNYFLRQNLKVGVITRGYGGQAPQYPFIIQADTPVHWTGDEPAWLYDKTKCPIAVGPNRVEAAAYLLSHYACDLIISDDGLQHYALGRTVEVVMIDGRKRFGNRQCMPAGPLRTPLRHLSEHAIKVCRGGTAAVGEWPATVLYDTHFKHVQTGAEIDINSLKNQSLIAVAGLADPSPFFAALRAKGLDITPHAFPDHHRFVREDFMHFADKPILMTEKDAIKCRHLGLTQAYSWGIKLLLPDGFWDDLAQASIVE